MSVAGVLNKNYTYRRGRADDPPYKARRTLHAGSDLLTPGQHKRLEALFANDHHAQVKVTWAVHQKMVAAYREPERAKGKRLMQELITAISGGVPTVLSEVNLKRPGFGSESQQGELEYAQEVQS